MANESVGTIPIFTINNFPSEVIERFAPDLRPRTISTLRLVCRRFRDVFTADRYYRCYLCYPNRLTLYHLDLEEIGADEGRWRRCLEKEKGRLDNWWNGRPTRIETVKLPSDLKARDIITYRKNYRGPFYWRVETGEYGENWLMSELTEFSQHKIVLLNITTTPPIFTVIDVSSYTSKPRKFAKLVPDKVLIRKGTGFIDVFNILSDGTKLSLGYLFTIEAGEKQPMLTLSGKLSGNGTYRSLLLLYKTEPTDAVLRVCDLKRAVELENIDLIELLSPMCASGLSRLDLNQASSLNVSKAGYPHVMVKLDIEKNGSKRSFAAVVNVEGRELTLWFGEVKGSNWRSCSIEGNYVVTNCSEESEEEEEEEVVRVYDLRMRPTFEDDSGLLFQRKNVVFFYIDSINPPRLVFFDEDTSKIELVCVDGSEVIQRDICVAGDLYRVTCVIGPFLVIRRDREISDLPYPGSPREVSSSVDMQGNLMFNWEDLLSEEWDGGVVVGDLSFSNLSKCVLVDREGGSFTICYF